MKGFLKFFFFLFLITAVGFFSYNIGFDTGKEEGRQTPIFPEGGITNVDFGIFWETWRVLEDNFLKKDAIDYQAMVYGAVEGMVDSLGDPYTNFFTPKQAESFEEELSGKYEGVGMYVGVRENQLTVISPLKGSPAEEAGLKSEDKILKIGETFTSDLTIDEAVRLIKGEKGTEVVLLIQRKDFSEPKEFKVRRDVIKIPTLEWEMMKDNIALIKIYQFNQILLSQFTKAGLEILSSGADSIIIDVRNNPGGYLDVVRVAASWFVEKGKVVVQQDSGEGKEKKLFKSEGPASFRDYPVVVLINSGSASASEILAGALRDQNGAKLVGEKSFGKGSIQEQISLSDKSSLKVTVAKWLTPSGVSIDDEGLEPDVEVVMEDNDDGEDAQLEKAIEIIQTMR